MEGTQENSVYQVSEWMSELQFSIFYFFRELAGGDRREMTLEEALVQFPAQILVLSSFSSFTLFCPSSGIQPHSQQRCRRIKPRLGYLCLNRPAIRFGSWYILLAWQWIHLFIFCLRIFYWLHNILNPTKDMRISQTTEYSPLRRERPDWGEEGSKEN